MKILNPLKNQNSLPSLLSCLTSTLLLLSSAQSMASPPRPYDYPRHRDISEDNYGRTNFQAALRPQLFKTKEDLPLNETIMVYDRYQRIFTKSGNEYKYKTMMARLDRLKVIDLNEEDENPYIKIFIENSVDQRLKGKTFYTRIPGLSAYEDFKKFDADVYMVQNIATEKLRVYQRICKDYSCPPKLIFETNFVAGLKGNDDSFKFHTQVGNYRIFEWEKFYQDRGTGGHYPSWYDPSFPELPSKKAGWSSWFKGDVMPWESCHKEDGEKVCSHSGMMRGAFGWYTAILEPNYATGQWTHGTIGWAKSSEEMIQRAKGKDFLGALATLFTSLRSSGCSRVSNPAIAFLRHLLPVGTPLIKIYALEAYQDQDSMERNYILGSQSQWDFILTKDGVREVDEEGVSAHKNYVQEKGLDSGDNILEEGTYRFHTYPSVVQYQYKKGRRRGGRIRRRGRYRRVKACVEDTVDNYKREGVSSSTKRPLLDIDKEKKIRKRRCNVYKIPAEKFQGRFYVDTGLVEGYEHPQAKGIIRGGFRTEKWPRFMEAKRY